ncbi:MAG TPA: FkbM family methyltransferase [Steroidobacteraceae bacterium]|jgi:FkbM family methyltransferase
MSLLIQLGLQVNRLLRHAGLELVRNPSGRDLRRIRLIAARNIEVVIDIGANEGQYGRRLRELGFRGWIHSYEPLPPALKRLRTRASADSKWKVFDLAVGETAGSATLHVAGNSESSSILTMARRHLDAEPLSKTVGSVEVRTTTLPQVLQQAPEGRTLLKIDTQGYEDRVLGAMNCLDRVDLIEVELSLLEVYAGQTLFREMDARIGAAGFELVSLADGFFDRSSGELLQMDAIYARASQRGGPHPDDRTVSKTPNR